MVQPFPYRKFAVLALRGLVGGAAFSVVLAVVCSATSEVEARSRANAPSSRVVVTSTDALGRFQVTRGVTWTSVSGYSTGPISAQQLTALRRTYRADTWDHIDAAAVPFWWPDLAPPQSYDSRTWSVAYGWPLRSIYHRSASQGRIAGIIPVGLLGNAIVFAPIVLLLDRLVPDSATVKSWLEHRRPSVRRIARGHCPKCGYDLLNNLSQGCPECGWNRRPSG